ncbi:MAG: dTDP-4-dehydrorhamnose reductase [Kiritimatiellae bacterium]|nr:dTDP-4-dehydrorhamnose reductase [Kiritimatiellia bacterium]
MKIVILGAKGMLGHDLVKTCKRAGIEVSGYDLPELDITKEDGGLELLPDCDRLINCAAYTNVDGAESDPETAININRNGAQRVAVWCKNHDIPLIHMSTDYVFDGTNKEPYSEDYPVHPINKYGAGKLAGEQAIAETCDRFIIIRTQSLFGMHGKNFVQAIIALLGKNDNPLRIVDDQTSAPTYTMHLAEGILRLLKTDKQGIVNISAGGKATWHEFACAIAEKVASHTEILKISSDEYAAPAHRPAYSVLDNTLYHTWTGHNLPSWQEGLEMYLKEKELT